MSDLSWGTRNGAGCMAMTAGSRSGAHIQPENTVVPGMPRPGHGRTLFLVAGLGTMLVWYPLLTGLLAHHPFDWSRPALLGLAFNSMLEHLLAGRFDVDPAAIDFEAFLVGDRTVSYFGIFCALLRLPLLLTGGLAHTDITWISCLTAVCLGGFYQLRAVLLVRDSVLPGRRRNWLCGALIACILFGGQQVQFLRPTIYQEVIHWAGALSMIFVFLAVRGLVGGRGFDARTLAGMAICAGLACGEITKSCPTHFSNLLRRRSRPRVNCTCRRRRFASGRRHNHNCRS